MSVLVYLDHTEGQIKKASLEALSYGAKLAGQLQVAAEGILLGTLTEDLSSLGKYGAKKIYQVSNESLNHLDSLIDAKILVEVVKSTGAKVVVFSNNISGKAIAPSLSAILKAGFVSGAVALPDTKDG